MDRLRSPPRGSLTAPPSNQPRDFFIGSEKPKNIGGGGARIMGSRHTIAIVENEPLIRSALTALLRVLGLHTVAHESAEAFIEEHSVHNFDCILADQNLPGMSGLEFASYLRARAIGTPLILMTGR